MRHLLGLSDLGKEGLLALLDAADDFRRTRGASTSLPLRGKNVGLVFEKASTRTRLSLELAVVELGGHPVVLTGAGSQMGRGEPIADTTRVLSRMVHAITFRTSGEDRLMEMVRHSSVPVLNALTDTGHPMQLLADLQTVRMVRGRLQGLRYAWVGDGNNMANSWIEAAGILGLDLRLCCPQGYEPNPALVERANREHGQVRVLNDPNEAVKGADVISTDVFASMGQEQEQKQRLAAFAHLRLTQQLLGSAQPDHVVLHCLPAHRGEEIDDDVLEGPRSFVWDEAECRLHTAKAALVWALGGDG